MSTRYLLLATLLLLPRLSRADICQDFFSQAHSTPAIERVAQSFRFDREKGIVVDAKVVKRLTLKHYSGPTAHRLETDPNSHLFKGIKEGLNINDEGGEPREFTIIEDYMEHYAENYMPPLPKKRSPPKVFVYRYRLGFRNGICIPLSVTKIKAGGERKLFDFDRCFELKTAKSTLADKTLRCKSLPVFKRILADARFAHGNAGPTQAPAVNK